MKISVQKLDLCLARAGINSSGLRGPVSSGTLVRIRQGAEVKPRTVGTIAKILGVDQADLIEEV